MGFSKVVLPACMAFFLFPYNSYYLYLSMITGPLYRSVFLRLEMVGVLGFEPRTSSLSGTRSNQLSYTPILPQLPNEASPSTAAPLPIHMVELKGLEPLTFCLQSRCSSQLS